MWSIVGPRRGDLSTGPQGLGRPSRDQAGARRVYWLLLETKLPAVRLYERGGARSGHVGIIPDQIHGGEDGRREEEQHVGSRLPVPERSCRTEEQSAHDPRDDGKREPGSCVECHVWSNSTKRVIIVFA